MWMIIGVRPSVLLEIKKPPAEARGKVRENDSRRDLSLTHYHVILQTRNPNLASSIVTLASIRQSLSAVIRLIWLCASSVLMHGTKIDAFITILSQSTTTLIPSGFKSSVFRIPCVI